MKEESVISRQASLKSKPETRLEVQVTALSEQSSDSDAGHDEESGSPSTSVDIESDLGAWLCVVGSLLFLIPSFGFMASLGTIQSYLSLNQLSEYPVRQAGRVRGLYLFLSLILNFEIGTWLDRYGPQVLAALGALTTASTFLLMAQCKTYWQFMLCFGVYGSIGTGIDAVTAIGVVGKLFTRRRGLAIGIAVVGTSLGSIIFLIMLR